MKRSPRQNLYLLRLAVQNGPPLTKGDIKPMAAKERNELEAAGLIELTKRGRTADVNLTDRGWLELEEAEDFPLSKSPLGTVVLQELFPKLKRFLAQQGAVFAELFMEGAPSERDGSAPVSSLADQIRAAYLRLTSGQWRVEVRLADLRQGLTGVDRESLDFCLLGMVVSGVAQARQIDDSLAIAAEDHRAALGVGGTPRHVFQLIA